MRTSPLGFASPTYSHHQRHQTHRKTRRRAYVALTAAFTMLCIPSASHAHDPPHPTKPPEAAPRPPKHSKEPPETRPNTQSAELTAEVILVLEDEPLVDSRTGRCQNIDFWGSCAPRTLSYEAGDPIPEGWRLRQNPNYALIVSGAAVGITSYVLSTVAAILSDRQETEVTLPDSSVRTDVSYGDEHTALFIPVAGPFITIAQADARGTGAAVLALDGTIQLAAIAMILGGVATTVTTLEEEAPALTLSPIAAPGQAGLMLSGTF